jgi:bifunctional DNA-binding transcriptional regulator/antitoxin component of YhaV-PrlF toxin-antitoxin module
MASITKMSGGRLTVPADVRKALGLESDQTFEVEASTDEDAIILRPAAVLRREDAWAYTDAHRELLARAHADSREGRVRKMSPDELAASAPISE